MRLAFMTFGVLREPWGPPGVAGFEERLDHTFAVADASPGIIARDDTEIADWTMADDDPRWGSLGSLSVGGGLPVRSVGPGNHPRGRDAFAVAGHRVGLRVRVLWRPPRGAPGRGDWFENRRWPTYVAWWVADDEVPTWTDAASRLDRLHADGPTPDAFDFHHPFDADGRPIARPPSPGRRRLKRGLDGLRLVRRHESGDHRQAADRHGLERRPPRQEGDEGDEPDEATPERERPVVSSGHLRYGRYSVPVSGLKLMLAGFQQTLYEGC